MTTTVVRYQTHPDRADENEALISAVFAELTTRDIDDVRYTVYRLADGSFVHIADVDPAGDPATLTSLDAFGRFVTGIETRTAVAPDAQPATLVGAHRSLAGPPNER